MHWNYWRWRKQQRTIERMKKIPQICEPLPPDYDPYAWTAYIYDCSPEDTKSSPECLPDDIEDISSKLFAACNVPSRETPLGRHCDVLRYEHQDVGKVTVYKTKYRLATYLPKVDTLILNVEEFWDQAVRREAVGKGFFSYRKQTRATTCVVQIMQMARQMGVHYVYARAYFNNDSDFWRTFLDQECEVDGTKIRWRKM